MVPQDGLEMGNGRISCKSALKLSNRRMKNKMTIERMQILFHALQRVEEYEGLASLFQRYSETSYIKQGRCDIARDRLDLG